MSANKTKKSYCHIQTCKNSVGAFIRQFMVPKEEPLRQRWIDSMLQNGNIYYSVSQICIEHFDKSCLIQTNQKNRPVFLAKNSVPTIFNHTAGYKIKNLNTEPSVSPTSQSEQIQYEQSINERATSSNPHKVETTSDEKEQTVQYARRQILEPIVEISHGEMQKCYICNKESEYCRQNLYKAKSQLTKTRICDFIMKWLGDNPTTRQIGSENDANFICPYCFMKINEYDRCCVTAKRIDKELRHVFFVTEKSFEPNMELDSSSGDFVEPIECDRPESYEEISIDIKVEDIEIVENDYNGEKERESLKTICYVFRCKICGEELINERMLKAHEHDRSNFEEIIKGEKCIQQKTVINDLNWNDGEKSKQKFFDCIKCPIQIVEDDYEEHMQSHIKPIDTLKCDKCGMYFENEQLLGEHLKLHEDAEPFQCVLCKKLYTSYRTLYCHCNHSHRTLKPLQCDLCGKIFDIFRDFHRHIERHRGPQPAQCTKCGKTISDRKSLKKHMFLHTGVKRHICSCGKAFAFAGNMRQHQRTHDKSFDDKVHQCSFCEKAFTRKHLLRGHMAKEHDVMEFQQSTSTQAIK